MREMLVIGSKLKPHLIHIGPETRSNRREESRCEYIDLHMHVQSTLLYNVDD